MFFRLYLSVCQTIFEWSGSFWGMEGLFFVCVALRDGFDCLIGCVPICGYKLVQLIIFSTSEEAFSTFQLIFSLFGWMHGFRFES